MKQIDVTDEQLIHLIENKRSDEVKFHFFFDCRFFSGSRFLALCSVWCCLYKMNTVVLPRQSSRGKLSIVRPGDQAQSQMLSRRLAEQEDFYRASTMNRPARAACICEWNGRSAEGFVPAPCGRIISNMGRVPKNAKDAKVITLEEILYLSEAHAISVVRPAFRGAGGGAAGANDPGDRRLHENPMSRNEVFRAVLNAGLPEMVYCVYAHLKRLGFLLRRHYDPPERPPPPERRPVARENKRLAAIAAAEVEAIKKETGGKASEEDDHKPSRQWWGQPFGPVPPPFQGVKVRVRPCPGVVHLADREAPLHNETMTSIISQCHELLACYDVSRPGKAPSAPPDMYVIVGLSIPAPDVLRALERCAQGRPVRIACCPEAGEPVFYSSEAFVYFT